jgi:hypothetical protein
MLNIKYYIFLNLSNPLYIILVCYNYYYKELSIIIFKQTN